MPQGLFIGTTSALCQDYYSICLFLQVLAAESLNDHIST